MTIERQLFDWENWDGDYELMSFYPARTKVQIGDWPAGTEFACINIYYTNGTIQFFNHTNDSDKQSEELVGEYKLVLTVGEKLG